MTDTNGILHNGAVSNGVIHYGGLPMKESVTELTSRSKVNRLQYNEARKIK